MAQKRLFMREIEVILRLKHEKKLTHRTIAQACSVSPGTASEYVAYAKAIGLSWPLPEGLSGEDRRGERGRDLGRCPARHQPEKVIVLTGICNAHLKRLTDIFRTLFHSQGFSVPAFLSQEDCMIFPPLALA